VGLAERDPEAFESLAKRLARTLDGRTLSRLKDRHGALAEKLERMARKLGQDPKKARRLKKLQSKLESLSKEISKRESDARSPELERLRKALTNPDKKRSPSEAGEAGQQGNAKASAPGRGKKKEPEARQGAPGPGKSKSSEKAKSVGAALKKISGDMARKKSMQRVRKRLEKTTSRVRREAAARRANERMRRFNKKSQRSSGPRRLSKRTGGASKAGGGKGAGARSGGSKAGTGSRPGSSHEKQVRSRKASSKSAGSYEDSVISNEGKSGSYRRRKYKASAIVGKDGNRYKQPIFEQDLDDEVLKSRIPSRYRETVRTYFKLLPEIFSE